MVCGLRDEGLRWFECLVGLQGLGASGFRDLSGLSALGLDWEDFPKLSA